MTYPETLDYLFHSLPMYHRVGAAAYKADIQPTLDLMEHLGHPEQRFRSIHVAGTNGKGSVSHLLASILQESGLRVGLYTSPHLVDFRERIRINGEMIPQDAVCSFVDQHRDTFERLHLSFFEMTVGLAFQYFAEQQVDIAIIEVGMGGRLDSTNVIKPLLSVITNIGLEHTRFLGNTLPAIAREKAGIIKDGVPVVIGETHPETESVFRQIAAERHAPIHFADQEISIKFADETSDHLVSHVGQESYECPLAGSYQKKNLVTLFGALKVMGDMVTPEAIKTGIAHVIDNTHFQGRWQTIDHNPLTICETAHNTDGIRSMMQKLGTLHFRHLHLIYGCVNDKNFREILQFLREQLSIFNFPFSTYYTQPSVPRALSVDQLAQAAKEMRLPGSSYDDVHSAIAAARAAAHPDDLILVTGSIFLVADALA